MTEMPDDVMRAAEEMAMSIIGRMCMTMDHSFGMKSEIDQRGLKLSMKQLAIHDITPVIARAILAERERCAMIAISQAPATQDFADAPLQELANRIAAKIRK